MDLFQNGVRGGIFSNYPEVPEDIKLFHREKYFIIITYLILILFAYTGMSRHIPVLSSKRKKLA